MQITLMRHGKYLSNGHISREGIEECIGTGLLLGNSVVGKQLNPPQFDWQLDKTDSLCISDSLPKEYRNPVLAPDLILTSPVLRAKETAFAFSEQLKRAKINSEIQYNVAYLDDLLSAEYKYNHNGINADCLEKLLTSDSIKQTVNFIQRLAKKGKKHIVIISHQPNIHALLYLLGEDTEAVKKPPENAVAYTFTSVNAEKISKEKYLFQKRSFDCGFNNALKGPFFKSMSISGIPILPVDYIEWYMPDFMFANKFINKVHQNDNGRK